MKTDTKTVVKLDAEGFAELVVGGTVSNEEMVVEVPNGERLRGLQLVMDAVEDGEVF